MFKAGTKLKPFPRLKRILQSDFFWTLKKLKQKQINNYINKQMHQKMNWDSWTTGSFGKMAYQKVVTLT